MKENDEEDRMEDLVEHDPGKETGDDIDEILEDIPKEARHEVKKMIGMSMQMSGRLSPEYELMKKMTPENVSEFLEGQKLESQHQFQANRDNKILLGFSLVVVLIFIVVLVIILRDNPDTMEKVLYALIGLVTGLFGGYGFGRRKSEEDQ